MYAITFSNYKLKCAAYHSENLNGVHAQLIIVQGDEILEDINSYLNSCNCITKAEMKLKSVISVTQ